MEALAQNEMISIIIPVYNVEGYLDRCIRSLVCQSYSNIEIILIDDGSTDKSSSICDAWAEADDRIIVCHRENGGAAAARNTGLDIARGEYIMFVDADDYVSDRICEMLITEIRRLQEVECVICGLEYINENGRIGEPQVVDVPQVLSGIEMLRNNYLYNDNSVNFVGPWAKLFRKSIWTTLRFEDGLYYEDLDISPYLYSKCNKVSCISYIGYYYYQRVGSASHGTGTDEKRLSDSLYIRNKHIAFYISIGQYEIANSICKKLFDLIITSDCRGWIPEEQKSICKRMIHRHWKMAWSSASTRNRIRYLIYRFGGARLYRFCTGSKGR